MSFSLSMFSTKSQSPCFNCPLKRTIKTGIWDFVENMDKEDLALAKIDI